MSEKNKNNSGVTSWCWKICNRKLLNGINWNKKKMRKNTFSTIDYLKINTVES